MATRRAPTLREAGQAWLLSCSPHPTDVRRAWAGGELARFVTGAHWRAAEAPLLRSITAMKRIGTRLGPVLADVETDLAWWLLPAAVGTSLDGIPQLTVRPAGWPLMCPPVLSSLNGRAWLERPDGTGRLTDPVLLAAAFGPGGYRPAAEASA